MNSVCLSLNEDLQDNLEIKKYYDEKRLLLVLDRTLYVIEERLELGLGLPYYPFSKNFGLQDWYDVPKLLDVYITEADEAKELNLNARGKDYATNILSYPSDLPPNLLGVVGELPLGELVICHDVVVREAAEQGKTSNNHLTHLLVHGILHLLGFDHELGQDEQDEMEEIEIEILQSLNIANPYEMGDTDGLS